MTHTEPNPPASAPDHARHHAALPGVPRWPATIALVVLAGAFALLPEELSPGPSWLVSACILVVSVAVRFTHGRLTPTQTHLIFLAISGSICAAVTASAFALITVSLTGSRLTPITMLRDASLVWGLNIFAFALMYWTLDAGGPAKRRMDHHVSNDFLFPQMTLDDARRDGWYPDFLDYLFLAFNTGTAFSPTDTLVLSRPAKVLMMLQSLISLAVIAVLVARGINTLGQ